MTPQPREIPAGKILLAEYAEVNDDNRARRHELERVQTPIRDLRIVQVSPGFEPAGSVARWTNGYTAVVWTAPDGARHGQHVPDLERARELAQEWHAHDLERAAQWRAVKEERER